MPLITTLCVCAKLLQLCLSLQPYGLQPSRLLCPWDFPGSNTGVGCHSLLQGNFSTQESNLCLLSLRYWEADSLPLVLPEKSVMTPIKLNTHRKLKLWQYILFSKFNIQCFLNILCLENIQKIYSVCLKIISLLIE